MYPKSVMAQLGGMDWLMRVPKNAELDNGVLSKSVLLLMDKQLRQELGRRMEGYSTGPAMTGTDPNNRWRVVSCLQKAIRFGNVPMAIDMASVGYHLDHQYTMRRMAVIAMEDVAAGDLGLCALVLAAAGSVQWRRDFDERRVLVYLAEQMARSVKDRTLTELVCLAAFDQSLDKEANAWRPNEELLEEMIDWEAPILDRMTAAWLMAGTKRFQAPSMPEWNERHPRHFLAAAIQHFQMPRLMAYLMQMTLSRCQDALFVGIPFMHWMLGETQEMQAVNGPVPTQTLVGSLLGAAYDMHTREGRVALRRFEKECKGVQEYRALCKEPVWPNDDFLGFGIFCAEGGVLERRAAYGAASWELDSSEHIRWKAHMAELEFTGLPVQHHQGYLEMLRDNLGQLNEIRKEVVWRARQRGMTKLKK